MRGAVLHEVPGLVSRDALDVRHLVPELDAVELVRVLEQLRPEGGRDELRRRRQLVDHVRDRAPVLSVEGLRPSDNITCLLHIILRITKSRNQVDAHLLRQIEPSHDSSVAEQENRVRIVLIVIVRVEHNSRIFSNKTICEINLYITY